MQRLRGGRLVFGPAPGPALGDAVLPPPGAAVDGVAVATNAAIAAAASEIVMIFIFEAPFLFLQVRTEAALLNRMHDAPVSAQ